MSVWLIETLLATSLLMIVVLALREPVRRAFGPSVAYMLWALPVLRLILPPLPGDWQLTGLVAPLLALVDTPGVAFGIMNPDRLPTTIADQSIASVEVVMADGPVRAALIPPVATIDGPSWLMLALGLWVLGALAFLIYQLVSYRRFCARIERQTRRRQPLAGGRIELIETDAAAGPLAFGIWRKVVAFPSDFAERYDEDERELALAHELSHHARGDLIANWVALVVLGLHWFNPIAWRAFRAFRADQEMACDHRVLAGRGGAFAHAYGRAIVKSAHGGAISAACHLHTINDLKGRLRMLSMNRKSRSRVLAGSVGVLALAIASLGLTASGLQAAKAAQAAPATPAIAPAAAAPAAPAQSAAPSAVPVAVSLPPSDADLAPLPPMPPLPAPPAPPLPAAGSSSVDKHVETFRDKDGKLTKRVRVIVRSPDGRVVNEDLRGLEIDVPEIADGDCLKSQGDGKQMVWHDEKDGKHRIIICRNRIEHAAKLAANDGARAAREAAMVKANSADIERNAYRSALRGLRDARAGMLARGGADAQGLKAIDEAIAEVEADLAKVN